MTSTSDRLQTWLTLIVMLGSGSMGGFFLAFSTITMTGLRALPDAQGMAAMQQINKAADRSPVLLLVLFGTGALCIWLAILAFIHRGTPGSTLVILGCVVYLLGTLILTMAYHVPHNNALAAVSPTSSGAGDLWRSYASSWTAWNHVRTLTGLACALTCGLALWARR